MKKLPRCAGAFVVAASLSLAAPPATALEEPERALIRAAVEATAPPQVELDLEVEQIVAQIDAIVARLGEGQPTARRARRLHRLLHRDYLRAYDRDADTLSRVFDDGAFNCLSASLLYGTIARSLGFSARALNEPGHLSIRLQAGERFIHVETTLTEGFDTRRTRGHGAPRVAPDREAAVGRATGIGANDGPPLSMPLEAAVGFAWLNRSWHDLDQGAPLAAARGVRRALGRLPKTVDQIAGARLLLARAFGVEYDAGRFDNAFEIAAVDAGLFPERTTARDRLVAAAVKRIETRCDADEPARALGVIDTVRRTMGTAPELGRLERRAYPGIAAAAVRLADWGLAREISDRYAAVQPDPGESARLAAWVEARRDRVGRGPAGAGDSPPVLMY